MIRFMILKYSIPFSLVVLFFPSPVGAEDATTNNAVTISALVQEVSEKNLESKFYEAELMAAKVGTKSAGVFPNPEFSGTLGHKRISSGTASAEGVAWSVS